jgi:hypothetical protein
LVKLPSLSATCADGKKNTSVAMASGLISPRSTSGARYQNVADSVRKLSLTTSHSRRRSPFRSRLAFSEVAGFCPMQIIPFTRPSAIATNIGMCEWSPEIFGCQS